MATPVTDAPSPAGPEHDANEAVVVALKPPAPLRAVFEAPGEEPGFVPGDTPLSAIERLSAPSDLYAQTRRRDHLLTAAWAVSFAALAALGVAGYTQRDMLMKQWPASKRVYATLGLLPMEAKGGDVKGTDATAPH
jgi:hypothetical protein